MNEKKVNSLDVVLQPFGKRKGLSHKFGTSLAKRIIETLDDLGFSEFFECSALMALLWKHTAVGM
jgi:hypothetical protein